jgi:di/tripeptidase
VEVIPDAQGHFTLDDVVLMRIPKSLYYAALRAAHERAVNTVSSVGAIKSATNQAVEYMAKTSGDFAGAVADNKIGFYKPGIEI